VRVKDRKAAKFRDTLRMTAQLADLPMLITPKQAAGMMGPTEAQIRGLIRDGRIAHVMVGKRIMIPRAAIEAFVAQNTVLPCRDETKAPDSAGSQSASASTSPGASTAAAASARLARQTANKLKCSSRNGSKRADGTTGQVIHLRSS